MNEARQKFEALIMARGREKPEWTGKRYTSPNIQAYWRWFYLGWSMNNA